MKKILIGVVVFLFIIPMFYGLKLSEDTINIMANQIYGDCIKDSNNLAALCDEEKTHKGQYKCEYHDLEITKSEIINLLNKINDKYSNGNSYFGSLALICSLDKNVTHSLWLNLDCYEWDNGECINQIRNVTVKEEYYFKDFTLLGFNVLSNGGFTFVGITFVAFGGFCLIGLGVALSFFIILRKKKFEIKNYLVSVKKKLNNDKS